MADRVYAILAVALATGIIGIQLLLCSGIAKAKTAEQVTVCFAADCSVSMAGTALSEERDAIERSVFRLPSGSRAALVAFREEAELLVPVSEDLFSVAEAAEELYAGGTTDISQGLLCSLDALSGIPGKRSVILFTDGKNGEERIREAVGERFSEEKISLFVVGILGEGSENLREIAKESGGSFVTLEEGERSILSNVDYLRDQRRLRLALMVAVPEAGVAECVLFLFYRKRKQREARSRPLPNAGYLKREEIRRLI